MYSISHGMFLSNQISRSDPPKCCVKIFTGTKTPINVSCVSSFCFAASWLTSWIWTELVRSTKCSCCLSHAELRRLEARTRQKQTWLNLLHTHWNKGIQFCRIQGTYRVVDRMSSKSGRHGSSWCVTRRQAKSWSGSDFWHRSTRYKGKQRGGKLGTKPTMTSPDILTIPKVNSNPGIGGGRGSLWAWGWHAHTCQQDLKMQIIPSRRRNID